MACGRRVRVEAAVAVVEGSTVGVELATGELVRRLRRDAVVEALSCTVADAVALRSMLLDCEKEADVDASRVEDSDADARRARFFRECVAAESVQSCVSEVVISDKLRDANNRTVAVAD